MMTSEEGKVQRLLIIENDPAVSDLLDYILKRWGYCVEFGSSGKEAIEKIFSGAFDAILLDIQLDDMDGATVYRKLKEQAPGLAQKVIFVTGDIANPETRSLIKQSGNRSLIKPFTLNQIKTLLKDFFLE